MSQFATADWTTPIWSAKACWLPTIEIAVLSAFIPPFNHVRDVYTSTNVIKFSNLITDVISIAERLKSAREEVGLTQAQLAGKAGVSQGTVANIESGLRQNPRELMAIAKAANVLPEWLKSGKGPRKPTGPNNNISPATMGANRIPLISYVQAGAWTEALNNFQPGDADEWLLTDLQLSGHAFALEIKGDSMLPDFKPGDRVIIDPGVSPLPGDFVAAKNCEESATFKKYRPRGADAEGNSIFELVPLNEDYPSIRSDLAPMKIVGTMVEHRKYRRAR